MAVKFLTISTDDVKEAKATITMTKTSDLSCSCNIGNTTSTVVRRQSSSSCPPPPTNSTGDTCLYGNWDLDLAAMTTLLSQVPAANSASVSDLSLSGVGGLSISPSAVASFTYRAFTINMNITVSNITEPETSVIDGEFDASVVYVAADQFSLDLLSGTGTVSISTPLLSEPYVLDIGDYFIPQGLVLHYVCSSTTLALTGFVDGTAQTDWVYYYDRV